MPVHMMLVYLDLDFLTVEFIWDWDVPPEWDPSSNNRDHGQAGQIIVRINTIS